MRVLKILREHKYSLSCLVKNDITTHLLNQTNEAIEELEKINQKTCINCKYYTKCDDNFNYCDNNSLMNGFIIDESTCKFFTSKVIKDLASVPNKGKCKCGKKIDLYLDRTNGTSEVYVYENENPNTSFHIFRCKQCKKTIRGRLVPNSSK